MYEKEALESIKKTDEILDLNEDIRQASKKILKKILKKTGAKGGTLFIYDIIDKRFKILSKEGIIGHAIIKECYKKRKTIFKKNQLAIPVMMKKKVWGMIYLYGKEFNKKEIEYVAASEIILDGKFKHEMDSVGLKSVFERYVGEKTMKKILKNPDKEELLGKKHNCTILFADINSFTKYTNTHNSKEVVNFLNNYFKEMSKIILKHGGVVDKFMGDAVMAIFGTPLPMKTHASRAIKVAKAMIKKMRPIAKEAGIKGGGLSVGIATGVVIAGNIGSEKLMDYTVIGRKVNLAARLTSFSGKNQITVDEKTRKSAKEFKYKVLENVELKGFKKIKAFKVKLS